jgi:hypothetical protein
MPSKTKNTNQNGRWVTMGGKKVFIADGSYTGKKAERSKNGKTGKNVPKSKVKNGRTAKGTKKGGSRSGKSGYGTKKR